MSDPPRPGGGPAAAATTGVDSLAAATARVTARRAASAASQAAQTEAASSARRYSPRVSRLPTGLQDPARRSLDAWDVLRSRTSSTRPAFRVGQADAELLDVELLELLKAQVRDGLKGFAGGGSWGSGGGGGILEGLGRDYTPEITLVLRAILFKLSIWDHDASYGATLQGLKYTDARARGSGVTKPPTRWQKSIYGLVTVAGSYGWQKWEDWLLDQEAGYQELSPWTKRLSRLKNTLSTTHSAAALISFLAFLLNGRYRTLLDRILRMRLAPPANQISREVSFEYLNRQLVWHAFTEFLLFILPLVGIARWRRWLSRGWRRTKILIRKGTKAISDSGVGEDGNDGDDDDDDDMTGGGELAFLPERTCAICYQDQNPAGGQTEQEILAGGAAAAAAAAIGGGLVGSAQTDVTNPYETEPCGHIYCFVCLASRLEAEEGEGWVCLRCGTLCKSCRPWGGDVIDESPARRHDGAGSSSSASGSGKSVRFEDVDIVTRADADEQARVGQEEQEGEEQDESSAVTAEEEEAARRILGDRM